MRKEFLSNIILILGLNLLIKPFYIVGIEAQVQNIVGTTSYGNFFALFNFCFLFQFFMDLGIQNYTSKTFSEDRQLFKNHFGHLVIVKLVLALLFISTIYLGLFFLGNFSVSWKLISLVILQMILLSFTVFVRTNLSALGHYTWDSILSALDKLILILLIGFIIYFSSYRDSLTLEWFVIAQIISLLVTLILALTILLRKRIIPAFSFSMSYTKNLLQKSYPYALVLLLMTLYTRMDGVMLKQLLADNGYQAGLYAAGYRIMDALNMLGYLFATLLLPMFAHIKSATERDALFDTSFRVLFTLVLILSIGGYVHAQSIMDILYDDSTMHYGQVFSILMGCFLSITIAYIFGSMATASGKLRELNFIYVVGILVNWGLNIYLIPRYLAEGAAYATLVTQFIVLVGLIWIAFKKLSLNINTSFLWQIPVLFVSIGAIFILLNDLSALPWFISGVLSTILALLVSFLLGFLRLDMVQLTK